MKTLRKSLVTTLGMITAAGMLSACAQNDDGGESTRSRIGDAPKEENIPDQETPTEAPETNGTEKPAASGKKDDTGNGKDDGITVTADAPASDEIYFAKLYELSKSLLDVDEALMNGGEDLYWLADFRYDAESVGGYIPDLVGYAIKDLSGDGIPELIVASDAITEWDVGMNIHNIYTIKDDECVLVIQGWGRSREYMLDNGEFYYEGSSGASESSHGIYRLSADGTEKEWIDFYFSTYNGITGGIDLYHNTTGDCDAAASEKMDIDEADFWKIRDDYEKQITGVKLTRLSDLADFGNCVEAQFAADYKGDASKLDHYDTSDDPYEQDLVITASEDVYDFEVHSVFFDDSDGPVGGLATTPIQSIGDLSADEPVVISVAFPGSMPNYAAVYTDKNGYKRILYFTTSGRDGSLEVDANLVFDK